LWWNTVKNIAKFLGISLALAGLAATLVLLDFHRTETATNAGKSSVEVAPDTTEPNKTSAGIPAPSEGSASVPETVSALPSASSIAPNNMAELVSASQIRSYRQILETAGQKYWQTSEGLAFRRDAHGACSFGKKWVEDRVKESAGDPIRHQNVVAQLAFYKNFCDAPLESIIEIHDQIAQLDHSDDVYRASGLLELADTEPAAATKIAEDLIRRTKSGEALEMAFNYFHSTDGKVSIGIGEKYFTGGNAQASFQSAQKVAVQMLSCEWSGRCGPDSLQAWRACSDPGLCAPGVSMALIWQRTLSSQIYEGALQIANELRQVRRQQICVSMGA